MQYIKQCRHGGQMTFRCPYNGGYIRVKTPNSDRSKKICKSGGYRGSKLSTIRSDETGKVRQSFHAMVNAWVVRRRGLMEHHERKPAPNVCWCCRKRLDKDEQKTEK